MNVSGRLSGALSASEIHLRAHPLSSLEHFRRAEALIWLSCDAFRSAFVGFKCYYSPEESSDRNTQHTKREETHEPIRFAPIEGERKHSAWLIGTPTTSCSAIRLAER